MRSGRSSSTKLVGGFGSPGRLYTEDNQPYNFSHQNGNVQKKRDDMMRRVKEIQEKVMPILKSDHRKTNEDDDISWQNRMEERMSRLETHLDELEKTMQIQLEKRVMEVEAKWERRFKEIINISRSR